MKHFIIIISLAIQLFPSNSISQNYNFPIKTYSANLDAYVGVWEYKSANEVFRINLIKGSKNTRLSIGETLIGDYFYQKDGVVLDNYFSDAIPSQISDRNYHDIVVRATNAKSNPENINPNKLKMVLKDKRLIKSSACCEVMLISPTQIRWILADCEGPVDSDFALGFSIPTDVILTKVQ
jgi:hypothetical protein